MWLLSIIKELSIQSVNELETKSVNRAIFRKISSVHAQILREHKQTSSITRVESASFHRLKLKRYKVLSSFAVKFGLRRYKKALVAAKKDKNTGADEPERAMVWWCELNPALKPLCCSA